MCGLAGFLDFSRANSNTRLNAVAHDMADAITHRGPDDSGVWSDDKVGIALSHRRLSIVDLSPLGHQPMVSPRERYVVAYNGEVYNFPDLRLELERHGASFRGHSDTEVILAAIEAWGLEAAVKRFVGMFAFALWDRLERRLSLVRDRLGIKPLYYGWANGVFVFGSELKALKAFPGFDQPIDRGALALFLRHNYVPAPFSIYQGISKLLPGHILSLSGDDRNRSPEINAYWSANEVAETGVADPYLGSDEAAIEHLDTLLRDAVSCRMVADVPLGAFLSGGFDSSTVVALMQAQSGRPVKTFSIGFLEEKYNEAEHAKAVAAHLGTDHTEFYVTPEEAQAVIPNLPSLFDEPFSDSSQIPTYLVSRLARKHVTVSLSGDGGDELFAGYSRYTLNQRLWGRISRFPLGARSVISYLMTIPSPQLLDRCLRGMSHLLPQNYRDDLTGDRIHKLAEILTVDTPFEFYRQMVSCWKNPAALVLGAHEPLTALTDQNRQSGLTDFLQYMMITDLSSYLPDDILAKVDRASMGASLEARVPLLDHRVVEFAWQLPQHMKIRQGVSKWILRQVLYRYVPPSLIERPKMGFGVPIDHWLRGPLRDWAESLLDERRLREEGFFDPTPIRQKWQEHLNGSRRWHPYLWSVLMFQAWLENE